MGWLVAGGGGGGQPRVSQFGFKGPMPSVSGHFFGSLPGLCLWLYLTFFFFFFYFLPCTPRAPHEHVGLKQDKEMVTEKCRHKFAPTRQDQDVLFWHQGFVERKCPNF